MNPGRLLGKYVRVNSQPSTAKMTHIKEVFAFVSAFFPRCEWIFSYGSPFNKVDKRAIAVELAKNAEHQLHFFLLKNTHFTGTICSTLFSYYHYFPCELCGWTELHQKFSEVD